MFADSAAPLTWNLARDFNQLFQFHFMVNAFRAGTAVAITAAAVGWFMVLRRQTFAGHTLGIVAFPGASAAIWLGVSATLGFFAFCIAAALVIAALPRTTGGASSSEEAALIGTVQAFALASGFLFVSLYGGFLNGLTSVLFGSFLGITDAQVVTLAAVAVVAVIILAVTRRPLLFSSVDPDVASARGVRSRLLSTMFLVVLGAAVAEASQITGALLVFALLVVPAASAQVLTARPGVSFLLATVFGIGITWAGLACAYYSPYPVGFWTTSIAFGTYVAARLCAAPAHRLVRSRA
ncbi:MAG: zinc/manganese transport system permease protein [Actinomycetota bacterium]|nr:zinc/manganese transport system permease protein [Actinomycetota bacterium]